MGALAQAIDARIREWPRAFAIAMMVPAMLIWLAMETVFFGLANYSPAQIVWSRYTVHLILLVVICWPRMGRRMFATKRPVYQLLRSATMLVMPMSFMFAKNLMPVGDLMAIFWSAPLIALVLGRVMLGERVPLLFWGLTALGVLGVMYVYNPGPGIFGPGALLGIAMAISFAIYLPMTRELSKSDGIVPKLFYTAFGVWVVLSLNLPLYFEMPTAIHLLKLVAIGVLGLVVLYLMERAAVLSETVWLAPLLLLNPLAASLYHIGTGKLFPSRGVMLALAVVFACIVAAALLAVGFAPRRSPEGASAPATGRLATPRGPR